MKRLREHWSWPSMVAPLAFGIVLALVVVSCGRADNPTSPSAVTGQQLARVDDPVDPTPTPTPTPTPPPTPTPLVGNCSPGFYKTHAIDSPGNQPNLWYDVPPTIDFPYCDGAGQPTCASLLADLNAGGQTSQAAAAYLNSVTEFQCDD
jgi:hypothetical protein